jgi:hypothetical protein
VFEPSSRYYDIEIAQLTLPDGHVVAYKRRRFVPPPSELPPLSQVAVAMGDRLDVIAARTVGDPEQFWRICDAHPILDPAELTDESGRVLHVPMPTGLGGAP